MSYQPVKVLPPCPILPCEHKLLGEGPMQDITTHRHDYVPKTSAVRPGLLKQPQNLYTSDCPLSDKTIHRMSYQPVKPQLVTPIRPIDSIDKPCGKIADKTIHNMSYLPWEPTEPVDKPWALKQKYQPPKLRMDDNTVHKMSYGPPGTFVECNDNCPDCVEYEPPCPEIRCCPKPCCPPPCTMPCCCPKAAC